MAELITHRFPLEGGWTCSTPTRTPARYLAGAPS